ncbi:MAG: phosphopyruvate hydratase [Parcubacteria group bacterium CG1_02_37_51]|uniref:Enolase n=3 Tax=Candidatus Komeiliibacteriota TaxID=1817908 RepID=A0A2M7RBK8_9BACT|nr:MAG: phosphopyruvate hydratase [Parcubacteria group bacterium CG1_02_37_51]PIY93947.1 MAG: phosphopyruvate hydratase [Candidatus Komeilibacteria bacterium CG_4_10_14_0_8_um_filter_37_78]
MQSDKIDKISATEILDSRGYPTVQVKITLDNGFSAKASVPSGASTGVHEALELRDNDQSRYRGKGVLKAVENVNTTINDLLKGHEIKDLPGIDQKMIEADNTDNKSKLGANAILGVSLAAARLGALAEGKSLYKYLREIYGLQYDDWQIPTPLANIMNGGKHADTNLDWQEFWIIPSGIKHYPTALRACAEIFHALGSELVKKGYDTDFGAEGGYAPDVKDTNEVWDMILSAVGKANYQIGQDIFFGLDAGSSTFYNTGTKKYQLDLDKKAFNSDELIEYYRQWIAKYPIMAIEDGLAEDDWDGWQKLTANDKIKENNIILIGDDLFTTNTTRLQEGIDKHVANGILIKPNQIGTLTETIEAVKMAQANQYNVTISHRSGETTDDFIADLAVAVHADFIKIGATSRGERIVKYNRLLEIVEELE